MIRNTHRKSAQRANVAARPHGWPAGTETWAKPRHKIPTARRVAYRVLGTWAYAHYGTGNRIADALCAWFAS